MNVLFGVARQLGGGFSVQRMLPQTARRSIGPFVFFDYFGPVDLPPGTGMDVRPHPHIGLATVTYLFDGSIDHRDSLGSVQTITPGAVNWMTAGRYIVHSERTGPEARTRGQRLHGIQSWIGLPRDQEECAPSFEHVPAADLPTGEDAGVRVRLIAGRAYGLGAPVRTFSDIFYADIQFAAGRSFAVTNDYPERALFVVEGTLDVGGTRHERGALVTFDPGEEATMTAEAPARAMLLGGAPLDGPRHVWWNFVSSSRERIEAAKDRWRTQPRGHIAGDDEFIPLPEGR